MINSPLKALNRFFAQLRPTRMRIRKRFKQHLGVFPDLRNPKTFNEKLQWRKLYDRNPLLPICADKHAVRDYVKGKIGEQFLIPLLAVVDRPEAIPWDTLPDGFVIKPTHGSGWVHVVRDKRACDRQGIEADCSKWLATNYYDSLREWQYKNIRPRLVVEQLLLNSEGAVPEDYKVHCFRAKDGPVMFINVDIDRFDSFRRCFYDHEWRKLPFTLHVERFEGEVPRPAGLDEMLRVAAKLSEDFEYVRVDLFHVDGRIYFGELTFHPGSGVQRFSPPEWDRKLGDYYQLPPKGRPRA